VAWADFEQHVENLSGQGCPANYEIRQSENFHRAKNFLAGEIRAVLRETGQDSLPAVGRAPRKQE